MPHIYCSKTNVYQWMYVTSQPVKWSDVRTHIMYTQTLTICALFIFLLWPHWWHNILYFWRIHWTRTCDIFVTFIRRFVCFCLHFWFNFLCCCLFSHLISFWSVQSEVLELPHFRFWYTHSTTRHLNHNVNNSCRFVSLSLTSTLRELRDIQTSIFLFLSLSHVAPCGWNIENQSFVWKTAPEKNTKLKTKQHQIKIIKYRPLVYRVIKYLVHYVSKYDVICYYIYFLLT